MIIIQYFLVNASQPSVTLAMCFGSRGRAIYLMRQWNAQARLKGEDVRYCIIKKYYVQG